MGATLRRSGPPELAAGLSVSSKATERFHASTAKRVWPCHPPLYGSAVAVDTHDR